MHHGAASARAETLLGAARGYTDIFVQSLGTGTSGAHLIDGEIGHVSLGGERLCS